MAFLTALFPPDLAAAPAGALALGILWALVNCFFGYVLFRVFLVIWGAMAGVLLGAGLVFSLRSVPAAADLLVACGGLAVLLGLTSWFFCRLLFAIVVTVGFCAAGPLVGAASFGPGAWPAWVLTGLGLGLLSFLLMRPMVIVLSALAGGLGAGAYAAALAHGQTRPGAMAMPLWVALGVVLTVAGVIVQARLARRSRSRLRPPDSRRGGSRASRSGGTGVHPRFTHV